MKNRNHRKSFKIVDDDLIKLETAETIETMLITTIETLNNDHPSIQFNENDKIKTLNDLLNCIETNFTSTNDLTFYNQIHRHLTSIVLTLLSCLIQSESKSVRLIGLKIIIYLSHLPKFHQKFNEFNIHFYIVRLIDLDQIIDEVILAIEHIRLVCQLYPNDLNETHFYCLISAFEDSSYKLNNLILETLLEMINKRPRLACQCQVLTELINYTINACNSHQFCNELIMQSLLKVMDHEECRSILKVDNLFLNLLAPIVDAEYIPLIYGSSSSLAVHHKTSNIVFFVTFIYFFYLLLFYVLFI
jgi:hypothetical protein